MLSAIVQKVTGQKVVDYLQPRLFDPLAIEQKSWETSPLGINDGGWGRLNTLGAPGQYPPGGAVAPLVAEGADRRRDLRP